MVEKSMQLGLFLCRGSVPWTLMDKKKIRGWSNTWILPIPPSSKPKRSCDPGLSEACWGCTWLLSSWPNKATSGEAGPRNKALKMSLPGLGGKQEVALFLLKWLFWDCWDLWSHMISASLRKPSGTNQSTALVRFGGLGWDPIRGQGRGFGTPGEANVQVPNPQMSKLYYHPCFLSAPFYTIQSSYVVSIHFILGCCKIIVLKMFESWRSWKISLSLS